jgi:tRNA(Ile)-lysidine synthase
MACRESGIQTLCLAHHQDDQYETVIMRLINGDRGFGLAGISASGGLPECYGKYGISESGSPYPWHNIQEPDQDSGAGKGLKIEAREGFSNPNDIDYAHQLRDWPNRYPSLPFESGGINVLRPLLSFTKEELRLTCLNYGVTWFEDQTNTDPTLTKRNAIRHVYQNATMPVALQKPSILSFAERWRARQGDLDRAIEEYSSLIVDIKSFNNRTGILKVRFNSLHAVSSKWSKSLVSSMPGFEDKLVLSTLRAVIEVVSPLEHIPLPSLSRTAKMLFPSLDQSLPAEDRPALPASFTVGCVQFEREQKSNPSKSPIWSIRRQNTMKSESAHTRLSIGTPSKVEVEWKLFDGRYWIGIQYYDKGQNIYVRFLQKEDLGKYKASLPPKTKLTFNRIMKDFAPGYTKFTLPAIVEATADGKEHVIALPTLNCHLPGLADQLRYSVRYKKIRSKWIFDKLRAGGPASPSSYALPTRPSEKWDELSHGGFL